MEDNTGLPSGLMSCSVLEDQLTKADSFLSIGEHGNAGRLYAVVQSHIETAIQKDQKGANIFAMIVGGIIGALVPVAHIITIPLGAYIGLKAIQNKVLKSLVDTPYYPIYLRAIKGVLNAAER